MSFHETKNKQFVVSRGSDYRTVSTNVSVLPKIPSHPPAVYVIFQILIHLDRHLIPSDFAHGFVDLLSVILRAYLLNITHQEMH